MSYLYFYTQGDEDNNSVNRGSVSSSHQINPKNAELDRPYAGIPVWENTYDKQAQMIDDELAYKYSAEPEKYKTTPFYPVSTTITGLFYDIGPTPSNAILS